MGALRLTAIMISSSVRPLIPLHTILTYLRAIPVSLKIGDIVCGILEKPHSERNSAALGCWDFGSLAEWEAFAPYTTFEPLSFNASSGDVFDLPQLGGTHFNRFERSSLSIAPPLVSAEVMRTISARAHNLQAASAEIQQIALPRCDGSVGCACARCAASRATIALGLTPLPPMGARPTPPSAAPPRLARISEVEPLASSSNQVDC